MATMGMLSATLNIQARKTVWFFRLAIAGGIFLSIQTAILNKLNWAYFFLA